MVRRVRPWLEGEGRLAFGVLASLKGRVRSLL